MTDKERFLVRIALLAQDPDVAIKYSDLNEIINIEAVTVLGDVIITIKESFEIKDDEDDFNGRLDEWQHKRIRAENLIKTIEEA